MKLGNYVSDFIANPFDPNKDGKTDAVELFLAVGLIAAISFAWKRLLGMILDT